MKRQKAPKMLKQIVRKMDGFPFLSPFINKLLEEVALTYNDY